MGDANSEASEPLLEQGKNSKSGSNEKNEKENLDKKNIMNSISLDTNLKKNSDTKDETIESESYDRKKKIRSIDKEFTFAGFLYDLVTWMFSIIFDLFFREIRPRGAYNIPRQGPVLFIAAPHANQFIDPEILMRLCRYEAGRRLACIIAAKSMQRPFIGTVSKIINAIPVARPQDMTVPCTGEIYIADRTKPCEITGKGTLFTKECQSGGLLAIKNVSNYNIQKIIDDEHLILSKEPKGKAYEMLTTTRVKFLHASKVDQGKVYEHVFTHFHNGGCIAIFPEGGSHDRPDLLPLKAGCAIMALGTLAKYPDCPLKIVPVGMNYFHPNKFRSRAVIEFGTPFTVPKDLIELYKSGNHRGSISELLNIVTQRLKSVTVTCGDFDTLMVIQAARRLYYSSSHSTPLPVIIEMNRKISLAYEHYKDDPRIIKLRKEVTEYNRELRSIGIMDHQVTTATSIPTLRIIFTLLYRISKLIILGIGSLPGFVLFCPVFIATKIISHRKAKAALAESVVKIQGKDVIGTWKILVAMGVAPALYWFYAILATYIVSRNEWFLWLRPIWLVTAVSMLILPFLSYAALRIGEVGMDIFKSIRPLVLGLSPNRAKTLARIRAKREHLSREINHVFAELGPEIFPDLEEYLANFHSSADEYSPTSSGASSPIGHRSRSRSPMSF